MCTFALEIRCRRAALVLCLLLAALLPLAPANAIETSQLAVVINMDDPVSYAIGEYYVVRRRVPVSNIIKIRFAPGSTTMSEGEFKILKAEVERLTEAITRGASTPDARPE